MSVKYMYAPKYRDTIARLIDGAPFAGSFARDSFVFHCEVSQGVIPSTVICSCRSHIFPVSSRTQWIFNSWR